MPRPPARPTPPPASFPFTAGSFDFPHASASPSAASLSSRDNRSINRALRSFSGRQEWNPPAALAHNEATSRQAPRRTSRTTMRRGPMHRLFGPPRDSDAADNLSRRPTTANPNRPRAQPSERYLRRSQARITEQRADMESAADSLDSLSDIPISNPFILPLPNTVNRPRSPTVEVSSDRRQTKRRKLEHSTAPRSEYDGFRYGYKGQVVPGRLKMEIVSCDGGEYYEKDNPALYKVQNVLKNDKSVYCSESSKCNLLLKHLVDAPFTLERVVIRAPNRGFTAPVQEGLIYVAMSEEELISNNPANLARPYPDPSAIAPTSNTNDNEQLSLAEAIDDPQLWQQHRRRVEMEERWFQQQNEQAVQLTQGPPSDTALRRMLLQQPSLDPPSGMVQPMQERQAQMMVHDQPTDHNSPRSRMIQQRFTEPRHPAFVHMEDTYLEHCTWDQPAGGPFAGNVPLSAPTPPPFTVTTASEDEDSDSSEEMPSAAAMADRMRRESRWRAESEDDDEATPRPGTLRRASALNDEVRQRRELRRRYDQSRSAQDVARNRIEAAHDLSNTLIAPHAEFFIAKDKSKITIKFHPPISGRNVLLRMWSPTYDGNIDIESVQFFGFSGPRYFPATQTC